MGVFGWGVTAESLTNPVQATLTPLTRTLVNLVPNAKTLRVVVNLKSYKAVIFQFLFHE